ncbi:tRNA pseudouridine(38-40) synthase TruA [bacterium]|nr:tRNA pseudouridine(38-40) synthase TruA [bacterium]MBU1599669.1 tRNA pseudouridine(38-40) synthase TruA [bacterium]MBU2461639.1 tRNA pseudouridine(38-40) synthase TruA [bacterium]
MCSSLFCIRRIKLTLSYDGTDYYGFQRQKDRPSVQGRIEEALFKITKSEIKIKGASRIDRGAHADGQVVAFFTGSVMMPDEIKRGLNSVLPKDIVVLLAEEVSADFNPRHAKERVYRYVIINQQTRSVFLRRYGYFYPHPLNVRKMQEATGFIIGRHDFSPFSGKDYKNPYREIKEIKIKRGLGRAKERLILFEVTGDSFLPHMIRTIIGALIEVGREKKPILYLKDILEKRAERPSIVPALGLSLSEVRY